MTGMTAVSSQLGLRINQEGGLCYHHIAGGQAGEDLNQAARLLAGDNILFH